MKDRDIRKDEINKITQHHSVPIREKAFFTIMRQSGLTPQTIKQLKIRDLEKILEPNTPIPCKITIPQQKLPTFIGHEAINYLKPYLEKRAKREKLTGKSLLFTIRNNPNKQVNTKDVSRTFRQATQKLHLITHEVRKGKPSELTLYSLKKFYDTTAKEYIKELKNNPPKNDEAHRKLYEELAMPSLEIELPTPYQMHQLENKLRKIEDLFPKETLEQREEMERLIKEHKEYEKWLREHPEQVKRWIEEQKEQQKKKEKWRKEHPEEAKLLDEQMEKQNEEASAYFEEFYKKHLEERVKELENKVGEIENIIKKPKETERRQLS